MDGSNPAERDGGRQALLERDRELGTLAASIERGAAGEGQVLFIEGSAGIGKTRLLRAAAALAEERGLAVLSARGARLERDFAYGVARQLLEPALATATRRRSLLDGEAGRAVAALDMLPRRSSRSPAATTSAAIVRGLYWLIAKLTEPTGMLLALDDAHWSDAPSRRLLAYLTHRLEELPLVVVLAIHSGEAYSATIVGELDAGTIAEPLTPAPLSEQATAQLVRQHLAEHADAAFCAACHVATAGNPFLVGELVALLRSDGIDPSAANAKHVQELRPTSVARAVLARLARLGVDAAELARAVAILGTGAELRWAQELAGVSARAAANAADALIAADVLSYSSTLEYVHPLAQSAVYESVPPARRALAHAEAARLLRRAGADAERVAAHLHAAAPAGDREAVESLCTAAAQANRRGAPEVEVIWLRRALAEPPSTRKRRSIMLALGQAQLRTGDSGCLETLRLAHAASRGACERSLVALELGRAMMMFDRSAEALDLWAGAREELGAGERALAALLEAEEIGAALLDVSTAARAIAHLSGAHRRLAGDSLGERLLLACSAYFSAARGHPASEAVAIARRALEGDAVISDQTLPAWCLAVGTLCFADRFEPALESVDAALAVARESGSVPMFQLASWMRALVQYRRGALGEAEADAQGALDAADEQWFTAPVAVLVDALLERGALDEAERLFEAYGLNQEVFPNLLIANLLLDTRGRLRCAQGRWRDGLADLLAVGARLASWETVNPAMIAWRSSAALAHLALDERDEARRLAVEEIELARSFGARRALGVALRAAGLVHDGEAGLALLEEALSVLEGSQSSLERARALTDYGAALRRSGNRASAREPLRRGLDLADRCGASALTRRAREELHAAGARPRRERIAGAEALTASERRVATLAAEGMSNREIAQTLFITVKTVKTHLGHTFQKLNIASRGELADALGERADRVYDAATL
jgi:DNA-binding CsgD family transcriptional regulator